MSAPPTAMSLARGSVCILDLEACVVGKVEPKAFPEHSQQIRLRLEAEMSRTAISQPLPEFVVHNGNASGIRPCHCDHQSVLEVGLWMSARIPISNLSVDEGHLFERKLADVIPLLPVADLVEITTLLEDETTHIVRCRLLGVEL